MEKPKNIKPIRRSDTDYNLSNLISDKPNYSRIYKKINIVNSILIILNNNQKIIEFFDDSFTRKKIMTCINYNNDSLSGIMFDMYHYLWGTNQKIRIKESDFINAYDNYIQNKLYLSQYRAEDLENFDDLDCNILEALEVILFNIYYDLNKELYSDILNALIRGNNQNYKYYIFKFQKENNSVISHNFFGDFSILSNCPSCYMYCKKRRIQYAPLEYFQCFFSLNFDLDQINNIYYKKKCDFNKKQFINIMQCFDFYQKLNWNMNQTNCKQCNQMVKVTKQIYYLPTTLTLIFNNNNDNNLKLDAEIDLSKFQACRKTNNKYKLVSILCKLSYELNKVDEYLCYCYNPKNQLWYSYRNGSINQVSSMNPNSIPIVAFYQEANVVGKKYSCIKIDLENQLFVKIKFQDGTEKRLFVNKNIIICDFKEKVFDTFNLDPNNTYILHDGKVLNEIVHEKEKSRKKSNLLYHWVQKRNNTFMIMNSTK
jgi:hypothetical protein